MMFYVMGMMDGKAILMTSSGFREYSEALYYRDYYVNQSFTPFIVQRVPGQ